MASTPDPVSDGALQPIIDWAGDVFYTVSPDTVVYNGYYSEWVRSGSDYALQDLPFHVEVTHDVRSLNVSAVFACVVVLLVLVTVLTGLKSLFIKGRR